MAKVLITALTDRERAFLGVPLLGGIIFGLLPLYPQLFAALFHFSGKDGYIYQLAGAATFGYAVVLFQAVKGNASWQEIKYVVLATLTFNVLSLYACFRSLVIPSEALPVVYLITATSVVIVAITAWLLKKYGITPQKKREIPSWLVVILFLASILAAVFGLFPLFPKAFASFFGYSGTDAFIYRQAGAACFGYAVMGVYELMSRNWHEIKLPLLMGAVFNGIGFLVSSIQIVQGHGGLLVYIVFAATFIFTPSLSKGYLDSLRYS